MFQSTTPRTPRRWNLCTACEQPLNADASSLTSQRRDDTELLHQVEQRRDTPVLSDLAVDDPHGVDGIETDLLPCGWNTEELPLVGAVIRSCRWSRGCRPPPASGSRDGSRETRHAGAYTAPAPRLYRVSCQAAACGRQSHRRIVPRTGASCRCPVLPRCSGELRRSPRRPLMSCSFSCLLDLSAPTIPRHVFATPIRTVSALTRQGGQNDVSRVIPGLRSYS